MRLGKTLLLFFSSLLSLGCFSQPYDNSVGLRIGLRQGFSYKHFFNEVGAGEVFGISRWGGIQVSGLYEFHPDIFNSDAFRLYMGGGAHTGYAKKWDDPSVIQIQLGLDAIAGMELALQQAPFAFSLDYHPIVNFLGRGPFHFDDFALTIKYTW